MEYIGVDLYQMGKLLEYLTQKRVVFLIGNGVQKYSTGNFVLQAIDSLAVILGHFGKEGSGVAFLGNSKLGFDNPFEIKGKKVQKAISNFGDFDTVVIQGGNPVASMPNSKRVIEELKKTKTIIYFGLYANETSAMADIVIPAKNFFEKDDVRVSYAHHNVVQMRKIHHVEYGISEYDFTNILLQKLGFDALQNEQSYIDKWLEQCVEEDGYYISPAYQETPYANGFDGDEFEFIEDFYDDFENSKRLTKIRKKCKNSKPITEFWLLTPKAKNALNTQFKRDNHIIMHPSLGFVDGEEIEASTEYGRHKFIVKNFSSMRNDTVLIYANAIGVNYLTPSILSEEGDNACYQEVKIKLKNI